MKPVALAFLAIIALAALACTGGQPTPAPISTPTTAPTEETAVMVATEVRATSEAPPPTGTTAVDLPVKTPAMDPAGVPTPTLTAALVATPTPAPAPTVTPVPTLTSDTVSTAIPQPAAIPTRVPTPTPTRVPTPTPEPTATAEPTSTPSPTATRSPTPTPMPSPTPGPTATPTPTLEPATDPTLSEYAPLLEEAVAEMDFVRDGLTTEEKNILDWTDSRLFSNPTFLASRWGPDNWPSEVKTASVQAIPLLMLEIDIQKKANGKHVITWGVDSLDRILDDFGIYEGVCVSCYGKDNYASVDEVRKNQYPIVNDQKHVHREMLKTFAYFAEADGEGLLMRSLMENDADDFEMLYRRVLPVEQVFTDTSFGWQNQSFMSQITLRDGTLETFPTTVYKVIGDAGSEREAVERWFDHLNKNMKHFPGGAEDFASIYRPHSHTPYTPEPGYLILVGEAGSPSSTGATTSALRLLGLKAEQFLSPNEGVRTGSVELNGHVYFYNGNDLGLVKYTQNMPACAFFRTLKQVENFEFDTSCGE